MLLIYHSFNKTNTYPSMLESIIYNFLLNIYRKQLYVAYNKDLGDIIIFFYFIINFLNNK